MRRLICFSGRVDFVKLPNKQKKYGQLPLKVAEDTMWKRANVDLLGPKTVKYHHIPEIQHKKPSLSLNVITMIDPATGWCAKLKNAPIFDKVHWLLIICDWKYTHNQRKMDSIMAVSFKKNSEC